MQERPLRNPLLRHAWEWKQWAQHALPPRPTVAYGGAPLRVAVAVYNRTWLNERQVEIPLALRWRDALPKGARLLEVGNVLSHYVRRRPGHAVVDRYERAAGVANEDFLAHAPAAPVDALLSISTFEHIGFDEPSRDASRFPAALDHARRLAPARCLVTVPLGYNPAVDAFVQRPRGGWEVRFLRRTGPGLGEWQEAAGVDPADHPYGQGCVGASAIAVLTLGPAGPAG